MLGNITLLNKDDIKEQNMILKYFYLIDPDKIVKELESLFNMEQMKAADNSLIEKFFNTTFEVIYKYSSLYNEYINPENSTYSTFFNEPGLSSGSPGSDPEREEKCRSHLEKLKCFKIFLKLFLRNHCITEGFFYELLHQDLQRSKITSSNDLFLKSGYFEKIADRKETFEQENKTNQYYYSKFKSFKDLGENNLLERLLNDCHCEIEFSDHISGKKTLTTNIQVPNIYKHWIYFIFCESYQVKNVCRNLTKINQCKKANYDKESNEKLLNNYKNLFYESISYNNFSRNCDKFIFNTLSEYHLGFSTINHINILLNEMHNPDSKYKYLKRYDSNILDNILKQMFYCPIPYTRHLFLFYAFEALRYNEDVKCNYLQHTVGTMAFSPSKKTYSEQTLSAKGLILITEFFNTINNITLPVLSSLWMVVLNNFIKDSDLRME